MAELTDAERLAEAKTALHSLLTGKRVDSVSYGDRKLGFVAGDIDKLKQYIAELEALVNPTTQRRRPFGVMW